MYRKIITSIFLRNREYYFEVGDIALNHQAY